ncbi:hypothetical protein BaRGS_00007530 [Batillaria attramentaria]|uniref:Bicarbonate transporter-like transmembrane domain-containing protein n=1 Tax=Batillaria attramentaria TaxID=370345 RepID=A0ABD0LPA9_9CAEN
MSRADDTNEEQDGSRESTEDQEGLQLLETSKDDDANANFVSVGKEFSALQLQDGDELGLLHTKYELVPEKDFAAEVRAFRDLEAFLRQAVFVLDLDATDMGKIMEAMLRRLQDTHPKAKEEFTVNEVLAASFAQDSYSLVARTIQGIVRNNEMGSFDFDQSWICAMCDLPRLTQRYTMIAQLRRPTNLGATCQEVQIVMLILSPRIEKMTKTAMETGRTFATLFMDIEFRHAFIEAPSEADCKVLISDKAKALAYHQGLPEHRNSAMVIAKSVFDEPEGGKKCIFGRGLIGDLKRRLPHYWSDYKDGFVGKKTPHKVVATTLFLYFACVLPNIAFGMLNSNNTKGAIGVKKILFSQMFGGILFAVFGGQPLIVLLTTAPLALYTKIIFSISRDFDLNFDAMFACVGLWNAGFLIIYALFDVSKLMRWSSRSTEEIFSLFITFAFSADAIRDAIADFKTNYQNEACETKSMSSSNETLDVVLTTTASVLTSNTSDSGLSMVAECLRENSILFLLLMLGTLWMGLTLFNFTKTPFLTEGKREILADYALPIAVLFMSFFGSFVFREIKMKPFDYNPDEGMFVLAPLTSLPVGAVFAAAGLGFSLSLLFFMDQNISSALVNTPNNKLKKGAAYHWDLFVVAVINGFLSIFTFPWVHAALPHSPLHVQALADREERIDQGHVHQIVVHVRETRVTGIVSHVLIGLSMLLLPYPLSYIPRPVLDGLFLYVAITALYGNQFFERILLLVTEQAAYPPNHYIRRVPQRRIHTFTFIQLAQLLVLCVFGFSPIPYMKMIFPVLLMFLMPIRHKLVPKVIEPKYLRALDGH